MKTSPITPPGACPGRVSAPVETLKNVVAEPAQDAPVAPGSQLGNRKGFTPRAITGIAVPPPTLEEFDGLNASAVAVADTLSAARLQMREKNVGTFGRVTVTATVGLIPKLGWPLFG